MYCKQCGSEVSENSRFCSKCGQTVGDVKVGQTASGLLQQLSSKINVNSIIWFVIAGIQVLIGIFNVVVGIELYSMYEDGMTNIVTGIFVLCVAVVNFISASRDLKYSKEMLNNPVGIYKKFSPLGSYVATLIYNLLLGGIVGIVGSIYALHIRSFVTSHKSEFDDIEARYAQNSSNNNGGEI